jgi:hypothetical protein
VPVTCKKIFAGVIILLCCCSLSLKAQPFNDLKQKDTVYFSHEPQNGEYDEILITVNVPRIGSMELSAVIYEEVAYLPVKELFDFLKIKNTVSADLKSVEGFFIDPRATYLINKEKNELIYNGKNWSLQPGDIVVTETGLYLRSGLFGLVFGLNCQFNFRNLAVNLVTNIELPALKEMKLEAMRKNLSQLKGEKKADTVINRRFSFFKLGMIDWSVISTQETSIKSNTHVTLGIGAKVLGGETDIFLNYYNDRPLKLKDQYYFWRYINNDHKAVRQVTLGKILANPSSTIYDGVTGIQVNNTPTTFRRSFGTYTLTDRTEPGWTVELYVNNVLVNFTKADASGFFSFEVPMVYGNSVVKLRFYGPWGEEKVHEQNLSIPFNFLPARQLEYSVNAGIVEDGLKSKFSRARFNYGLSSRITIGGGMEYLSSVSKRIMPFVDASVRITNNMFFNGEYIHKVRAKALLSYRFPSNLRIELNYLHFDKDQQAIKINYLDEKRMVVSKSFRGAKFSGFSRLTLNQFTLSNLSKKSKYTSGELLMSAVAFGISSNLTSYLIMKDEGVPLAYSNLSMTFRLPHGFNILPQVQYEYNRKDISFVKAEVEKSLFKRGFLNVSFEKDLKNNLNIFGLGFRYNFSFMQAGFTARQNKVYSSKTTVARGSVLMDAKSSYLGLSNENNVGKGGLIIAAFLDLNNNGKREKGEPAAPGLKLKVSGGRVKRDDKDTSVRVTGLDPYTSYYVELNRNSFDNIAWQIRKPTLKVTIDPNYFTYIAVPVSILGEINGTVYLDQKGERTGLGRMLVDIYNSDSTLVMQTISEADGYFSYLGLAPGNYFARINADQINKLKMDCQPASLPFVIRNNREGDAVTGIKFTVYYLNKNETPLKQL